MLSTGIRIQVKTATLTTKKTKLKLKTSTRSTRKRRTTLRLSCAQEGNKHKHIRCKKLYSEECDYFIIFGVDEGRFWIVPSFDDDRHCLMGNKDVDTATGKWTLRSKVASLSEIAKTLGVCEVTVWKRKRGDIRNGSFVRAVRMCEDKWEFLNAPPSHVISAERNRDLEVQQLEQMLVAK